MAVSGIRMTSRALFALALAFYINLAVAAGARPEWQWSRVDVSPHNPFLIQGSVDERPSRYKIHGCDFHPPDAIHGLAAKKQMEEAFDMIAKVVTDNLRRFDGVRSGASGSSAHGPTVVGTFLRGPKKGGPVDLVRLVHATFPAGDVDAAGSLKPRFNHLKHIARLVEMCYGPSAQRRERLVCLQDLSARMTADTLFFAPIAGANFAAAATHRLSLVFAALYPAVVQDLLAEMNRRGMAGGGGGGGTQHAHEIKRATAKLGALLAAIEGPALAGALMSVLPLPHSRSSQAERLRNPANLVHLLGVVAGRRPTWPASPTSIASLRSMHAVDRGNDGAGAASGPWRWLAWWKSNAKPFPNIIWAKRTDARTKMGPLGRFSPTAKHEGWDRFEVAVRFAADTTCEVRGEHWCGYVTRDGRACDDGGRGSGIAAASAAGAAPAECRAKERYHCRAAPKDVAFATRRIVQSRVEEYYADAAPSVLDEIVAPARRVFYLLLDAKDVLEGNYAWQ